MKNLVAMCVVVLAVLGLASCSGGGAKSGKLLGSVPGDAEMVVVVNGEQVVSQLDIKVSGKDVVVPDELSKLLERGGMLGEVKDFLMASGVDVDCVVGFMYQGRPYVTGLVDNEKEFKTYVEKLRGGAFVKDGEMEVCRDVVLSGEQFWVVDGGNVDVVGTFASLKEKDSFGGNAYSSTLGGMKRMVEGIVNLSVLQQIDNGAIMQLGLAAAFGDARYICFSVDSEKGGIEAEAGILNSEFKPAKAVIGLAKIDMSVLKSLKGTPGLVIAFAIDSKVMEQVKSLPVAQLGGEVKMMLSVIENLDGTVAMAISMGAGGSNDMPQIYGVAECKSKEAAQQISGVLNAFGARAGLQTEVDGKKVLVSNIPSTSPNIDIEDLDEFKGEGAGVLVGQKMLLQLAQRDNNLQVPFRNMIYTVGEEHKSVVLKFKANTKDGSVYGIKSLLDFASSMQK